jgi:hypothetical protein
MSDLQELFYPHGYRSIEEHKKLCEPVLSKYTGLPKSLAIIQAKNEGWGTVCVGWEDGVSTPLSSSFNYGRIRFEVENNIVRKADVG